MFLFLKIFKFLNPAAIPTLIYVKKKQTPFVEGAFVGERGQASNSFFVLENKTIE
jgi:hypothetical protein